MNKKKRNARIKHRKNQKRVKKINQLSLQKAKPKKNITKVETEIKPAVQDTPKASTTKKTTAKKTTAKKATAKKAPAKKTTSKKASTKKASTKKVKE